MISKKLKIDLVDINSVAKEEGIFEKKNRILDVDVEKLRNIIDRKVNKNSLLVGHLAPYVVSSRNVESVIVLRRSPYKLQSVYKKRHYTRKKTLENLGSEILGIIYYDALREFGKEKTFQIDTTDKSISVVARKVGNIFRNKKGKEERVDWLQLVMKKGDMQRFFSY